MESEKVQRKGKLIESKFDMKRRTLKLRILVLASRWVKKADIDSSVTG